MSTTIRGDGSVGRAGPTAEELLGQRQQVLAAEVTGHDQRGTARVERLLVGAPKVVRRQALDGLAGPA